MAGVAEESWVDEQDKFLQQAQSVVKQQTYFMKRALDAKNLSDALKHSSTMICELRTSLLTPKNYFELYIQVVDELRHLEMFFEQEHKNGRPIHELYQLVQHAGNILPRLYLLVTVGAVYMQSKEVPAKDILKDLVEMCKGVQHPMRGLFLRNYLSQMTKDKLPDVGNDYDTGDECIKDTIDFVVQNFHEMNKLWVRMQHQGPVRERDKREKERLDLCVLVGTNLVRLSNLEGVDKLMYAELVLPRVLENVVNCKDQIAQQYLMEILIQVFPDEMHLATLEPFLSTCTELQSGVDVKGIFIAMADRLAKFAQTNPEGIPETVKIFNIFTTYVAKLIQNQTAMELKDILSLQVALLNFAIKCYPERLDYVDHVLHFCSQLLSKLGTRKLDRAGVKHIVQLLLLPLDSYKNILVVLDLTNYADLMGFLDHATRKTVALSIVRNMTENNTMVNDPDKVTKLYSFVAPLIKDEEDAEDDVDDEDFAEEQNCVGRLVHLYQNDDTDQLMMIYIQARKQYGFGGVKRIQYTLPSLVFRALQLAVRINTEKTEAEESGAEYERKMEAPGVFKFVREILAKGMQGNYPEVALRLYLQAAQAADACGDDTNAREFMICAYETYEEELGADSKAQCAALHLIIGTLQTMSVFGDEDGELLRTKCAQYAGKIMKRADQARALTKVSHLFWAPGQRVPDGEEEDLGSQNCLKCLHRAVKNSQEAVNNNPNNVLLYVEILNEFLFYYHEQCPAIASKYLSGLITTIKQHLKEEGDVDEQVKTFFNNTLTHIVHVQEKDEEHAQRYQEIIV